MWEGSEISHEFAPECLARAGFIWRSRGATLQLWTMQRCLQISCGWVMSQPTIRVLRCGGESQKDTWPAVVQY